MTSAHEDALRSAGLVPGHNDLWQDDNVTVGAVITPSGTFVGWLDVVWPGPSTPRPVLRAPEHVLPDMPTVHVLEAVRHAEDARARALCDCGLCGGRFVPGHMHDHATCQGCAERHLGVMH